MRDVRHVLDVDENGPRCGRCGRKIPVEFFRAMMAMGVTDVLDVAGLGVSWTPDDGLDDSAFKCLSRQAEVKDRDILAGIENARRLIGTAGNAQSQPMTRPVGY